MQKPEVVLLIRINKIEILNSTPLIILIGPHLQTKLMRLETYKKNMWNKEDRNSRAFDTGAT